MALIPAVYVTIEDKSSITPAPATGRVGLAVILSDRGPHNRVFELNSQEQLYQFFGKPDFDRTGQGHYMADKFLQRSNRLLVVRPSLMDSDIEEENAAIANFYVKYNADSGSSDFVNGIEANAFKFTKDDPHVIVNHVAYESFDVNEYLLIGDDSKDAVTGAVLYRKIIDKNINHLSQPQFILDSPLDNDYYFPSSITTTSTTTTPTSITTTTPTTITTSGVNRFFPGTITISYNDATGILQESKFKFINGSNEVIVDTAESLNSVRIKDWIYPTDPAFDGSLSRQVIDKVIDNTNISFPIYKLILDSPFTGTSSDQNLDLAHPNSITWDNINSVSAYRYTILEVDSTPNLRNADGGQVTTEVTDPDNIWYFTAIGSGSWANNLYYVGIRNIELEKMYTDNDGNPIYKYAFMDLYLYHQNNDGTSTLLEGPFAVSLIRTTSDGQIIRDIYSGTELYIESVINLNSNYVRCSSSSGADFLLNAVDAELIRMNVQSLFANEKVYRSDIAGFSGVMFGKGDDGIQYDARGILNITHPKIQGLIGRVFAGQLPSIDGSIENLDNVLYPMFRPDYIIAGGYAPTIQNEARALADRREDCLVLADTGGYYRSAAQDIDARNNNVPWNTWNAALYVQYQRTFDNFTGKYIWLSPVYSAIERHLEVDQRYWIAEPVAGIEKGAIQAPITLSYRPSITQLEDLMDKELNPVIVEPDGTYILTQVTTWKRLSVMKRIHAVKFVHFVKKNIPSLLKDILQRKMTGYWVNMASQRINAFMSRYVDGAGGTSERYSAITNFSVSVTPDEARGELNVTLTLKPIRAIESINVSILVQ